VKTFKRDYVRLAAVRDAHTALDRGLQLRRKMAKAYR
jgi:hypothetical protein